MRWPAVEQVLMDWGFVVIVVGLAWRASRYPHQHPYRLLHLRMAWLCGALWLMRMGDAVPGVAGRVWTLASIVMCAVSVRAVVLAVRQVRGSP